MTRRTVGDPENLHATAKDDEDLDVTSVPVPKSIRIKGLMPCVLPDIDLHPSQNLLAATTMRDLISYVEVYKYNPEEKAERLLKLKVSRKESRAISFSKDGSNMFCVLKGKTMKILDTNTGITIRTLCKIHNSQPSCICSIDENLIATGDEDGQVKVWDIRHQDNVAVMSDDTMEPCGITQIRHDQQNRLIFAVSADGIMATYNARQRKFLARTEMYGFGLNCAETIKGNTKLVVGTSEGLMHLYNWDEFAAPSDSFTIGASIESMTRVSDDVVFAACGDHHVRAISILPNRVISKAGSFSELYNPKKVVCSWDDKFVAGHSFDGLIKFFDVEQIRNMEVSDREKTDKSWKLEKKVNQHRGSQKSKKRKQQALDAVDPAKRQHRTQFFSDLNSDLKVPEFESDEEDEKSS